MTRHGFLGQRLQQNKPRGHFTARQAVGTVGGGPELPAQPAGVVWGKDKARLASEAPLSSRHGSLRTDALPPGPRPPRTTAAERVPDWPPSDLPQSPRLSAGTGTAQEHSPGGHCREWTGRPQAVEGGPGRPSGLPRAPRFLPGPHSSQEAGRARPPPELLDKGFQRLRRADSAFGAAAE